MSVPRTGTGAYAGAGTASIHSSYGWQVGMMKDGQLQRQPTLYAARETERERSVSQEENIVHYMLAMAAGCCEGIFCAC